jgi:hypothetical protein
MRIDPRIPVGGPSGPSSSRMAASISTPIFAAMCMRKIKSSGLKALLRTVRADA